MLWVGLRKILSLKEYFDSSLVGTNYLTLKIRAHIKNFPIFASSNLYRAKSTHNTIEMKVSFFHVFLNILNKYTLARISVVLVENWWLQLSPKPLFYSRR
jgi:hypothetical protein